MRGAMGFAGLVWLAVACGKANDDSDEETESDSVCDNDTCDEDEFFEQFADNYCTFVERCYLAVFRADYSDRDDCLDDVIELNEDIAEEYEQYGCDYDAVNALDCIDATREMSETCEQRDIDAYTEACGEVWEC